MEGTLKLKELPLLSLGAAFAFVIMMFNVPLPGGTSGHMAGAVVVAIVLGPWASVVALTVVLTLQALLFGDGGVTTLGANAFNVAFVMSFVGHYVYTLLCGSNSKEASVRRRTIAAAVAAYLAVNASALCAAFELGLQPLLSGTGPVLYAPYSLGVTLPAMLLPHILFVGVIEALGTAMVVAYLFRAGVVMPGARAGSAFRLRPLWFALAGMDTYSASRVDGNGRSLGRMERRGGNRADRLSSFWLGANGSYMERAYAGVYYSRHPNDSRLYGYSRCRQPLCCGGALRTRLFCKIRQARKARQECQAR